MPRKYIFLLIIVLVLVGLLVGILLWPKKIAQEPAEEEFCQDFCGDGICQEIVCLAIGCPCAETAESCPQDCQ